MSALDERIADGTLVCPACHGRLATDPGTAGEGVRCAACGILFPIVEGRPALIAPRSAFHDPDGERLRGSFFGHGLAEDRRVRGLRRALPALAVDWRAGELDRRLGDLLAELPAPRRGLVVGAGERPAALAERFPDVDWLTSDVDGGWGPQMLADVQWLPVADGALDVAIAEMVLEHVMDPLRAARELERVVRPGGLLLVTVPFCFPWHGIPIDFFRCTPAGVRALFRRTEVLHLDRGMGPWGALAYQLDAAAVNLTAHRFVRRASVVLGRFAFGWLKWLDRLPLGGGRGLIGAGGVTYLARRVERPRGDAEILAELRDRFGSGPGSG